MRWGREGGQVRKRTTKGVKQNSAKLRREEKKRERRKGDGDMLMLSRGITHRHGRVGEEEYRCRVGKTTDYTGERRDDSALVCLCPSLLYAPSVRVSDGASTR